ncbi:hypothetical protein [Streptomyces tremellae]|uniref:Uncharacterized protein n=1 Tax=Streptomyces tremellae TaxID=1124239 RepID=A0ABP7EHR4_9ACTN
MAQGYGDVRRAVRDQKRNIWIMWAVCGGIWLLITRAVWNVPVLGLIMQIALVVLGIAATIAAFWLSGRVQRIADRARDETLRQAQDG